MLFNSLAFAIFFPIVTLIYFLIPYRWRWLHLLIASCIFYMFFIPIYILILIFTIIIDYIAGILIENAEGKKRKLFLILSLISNMGGLAIFKYYNFFIENLDASLKFLHIDYASPLLNLILPIGLSFHTFQAMSYTIEVYRGNQKAERHFGIYSLYVMFYPQLVAGPIERPQNLIHQFYEKHDFDYQRVTDGLKFMLWGMFKKVVIADRLAIYVDKVYNNPLNYDGWNFIIATIFFAFQIYCDFSGYSDIAIGAARVMGFKLMTNFNRPYHARSIAEFWKRWHISLSTWFRDYLYIPLGGNRTTKFWWYFNLFLTFLISGVWHGAKWTFVIWGALNGLYLLVSIWTEKPRKRLVEFIGLDKHQSLRQSIQLLITFTLTCYAWLFFRANSLTDVIYIHRSIASSLIHPFREIIQFPFSLNEFLLCLCVIAFLELIHYTERKREMWSYLTNKPLYLRWAVYYGFILVIFYLGGFGSNHFIYFQF
jgi:alginate O-acetyltransferase complex protein AlgI